MSELSSIFENEPIDESFLEEADTASDKLFDRFDTVFGRFDQLHDVIVESAAINYKKLMMKSIEEGATADEFAIMEAANEDSLGQKLRNAMYKLQQMWQDFIRTLRKTITEKILNKDFNDALKKLQTRLSGDTFYKNHNVHYVVRKDQTKEIGSAINKLDTTIAKILSKWRRPDSLKGMSLKSKIASAKRKSAESAKMTEHSSSPVKLLSEVKSVKTRIEKVLDKEDSEVGKILSRALSYADTTESASLRDSLIEAVRIRTELSKTLCKHCIGLLRDYTRAIVTDANHWRKGGKDSYMKEREIKRQDDYDKAVLQTYSDAHKSNELIHQLAKDRHKTNVRYAGDANYAYNYAKGFEDAIDLSELMDDEEVITEDMQDIGLSKPATTSLEDEYLEEMNELFNDEFDY